MLALQQHQWGRDAKRRRAESEENRKLRVRKKGEQQWGRKEEEQIQEGGDKQKGEQREKRGMLKAAKENVSTRFYQLK